VPDGCDSGHLEEKVRVEQTAASKKNPLIVVLKQCPIRRECQDTVALALTLSNSPNPLDRTANRAFQFHCYCPGTP
jgi:hypothetical protein